MVDLEKLLSDDKFLDRIANSKSDEEVKQIFKDNGLELDDKQIEALKANLKKTVEDLSQEELGGVSGGGNDITVSATFDKEKAAVLGTSTALGAGVGAYVGYIRGALRGRRTFRGGDQYDAFKHVLKSALKGALKGTAVGAGTGLVTGAAALGLSDTVKDVDVSERRKW